MMIKLCTIDDKELWLNTSAISSVLEPIGQEQDMGVGAKIYITGEESPWMVLESVSRVIHLIEGVS